VEELIEKGVNVNSIGSDGRSPLHWACENEKFEIIKLLLIYDADTNSQVRDGDTPLHVASCSDLVATVKLLFENGADVNAKNNCGTTHCTRHAIKVLARSPTFLLRMAPMSTLRTTMEKRHIIS